MYHYEITSSSTYDLTGAGYALSSILNDFELNPCDGTLRFKGTADNTVITTYSFNIQVCLTRNPNVCNNWTENVTVKVDLFSAEKIAGQMLSIPVDADPVSGDKIVLSLLPINDTNGNALTYNLSGDSFGLFYLGSAHNGRPTTRRVLAQDAIFPVRNRKLDTSTTTYELRFIGTTTSSSGSTHSFSLQVYDHTGTLQSDESYSVPVAGTMATYSTLAIPVVTETGGTTVSATALFGATPTVTTTTTTTTTNTPTTVIDSISTDNSAMAWLSSGNSGNYRKTTYAFIIGLSALFFVPGWLMIIMITIGDLKKPLEKKTIKWSRLFWWQWMFAIMAPLLLLVTKSVYQAQLNERKEYASTVFESTNSTNDVKPNKVPFRCCKKTSKVSQDPSKLQNAKITFKNEGKKQDNSEKRELADHENLSEKSNKDWEADEQPQMKEKKILADKTIQNEELRVSDDRKFKFREVKLEDKNEIKDSKPPSLIIPKSNASLGMDVERQKSPEHKNLADKMKKSANEGVKRVVHRDNSLRQSANELSNAVNSPRDEAENDLESRISKTSPVGKSQFNSSKVSNPVGEEIKEKKEDF